MDLATPQLACKATVDFDLFVASSQLNYPVGTKYMPTNFSLLYVVKQLVMFIKLKFCCSVQCFRNIHQLSCITCTY